MAISRSLALLALAAVLLSSLTFASAKDVRRHASQVVELTPENYDEYVNPNRYTFVLYCTPWARECPSLEVLWDGLSISQLKNRNRDVFVAAKVNAKKYPQLARRAGVRGYPSMIYYTADEPEGIEYRGVRELALLDSFVFQYT